MAAVTWRKWVCMGDQEQGCGWYDIQPVGPQQQRVQQPQQGADGGGTDWADWARRAVQNGSQMVKAEGRALRLNDMVRDAVWAEGEQDDDDAGR